MDKTIVEVYVPLLAKSYDMFIPPNVQMHIVLELIKKAVTELSEGQFMANRQTVICSRETGKMLDINKSAYEQGVKTGAKLMLI